MRFTIRAALLATAGAALILAYAGAEYRWMLRESQAAAELRRVGIVSTAYDAQGEVSQEPVLTPDTWAAGSLYRPLVLAEFSGASINCDVWPYLQQLRQLERLRLQECRLDACPGRFQGMRALKELEISQTAITAEDLRGISNLTRLTALELDRLENAPFPSLELLGHVQSLEQLTLNQVHTPDQVIVGIARLPRLEKLSLRHSGASAKALSNLASLTELNLLNLAHTEADDTTLNSLLALGKLESLDLSGTRVTDQAWPW